MMSDTMHLGEMSPHFSFYTSTLFNDLYIFYQCVEQRFSIENQNGKQSSTHVEDIILLLIEIVLYLLFLKLMLSGINVTRVLKLISMVNNVIYVQQLVNKKKNFLIQKTV